MRAARAFSVRERTPLACRTRRLAASVFRGDLFDESAVVLVTHHMCPSRPAGPPTEARGPRAFPDLK